MTNEQLTQEVIKLAEHQAKCDAERERILTAIEDMRENIKDTKNLAEDVHIMAVNMQNMQRTLEETNQKVDSLSSKEFKEYTENKKTIKSNIISAIVGSICTFGLGAIAWILTEFISKGG